MKYFLIAGEASGDLHASRLVTSIKKLDPAAEFMFIGGDLMQDAAGQSALMHFRSMNVMGFTAVIGQLFKFGRILKQAKDVLASFQPDVFIPVDYAGFNLRMAKFAKKNGIPVFYYISPKVWAWRKSRIKIIRKYVDRMFAIFPFEVDFFQQHNVKVEYEGNPLMDVLYEFRQQDAGPDGFKKENNFQGEKIIALLAGSRNQEITLCLPEMVKATANFPGYMFVVAGAPSVDPELYSNILGDSGISVVYGKTYQLLSASEAAIVTSGTATLETALLNVPEVVVYKTGKFTYGIGKLFITFRFFSLVNLILGRELVKELLQDDLAKNMSIELQCILNDTNYRSEMIEGYGKIREMLGEPGVSGRIAHRMIGLLSEEM